VVRLDLDRGGGLLSSNATNVPNIMEESFWLRLYENRAGIVENGTELDHAISTRLKFGRGSVVIILRTFEMMNYVDGD